MISVTTRCLLFLSVISVAQADFGDYADLTFECPAYTTCPILCVAETVNCPSELQCLDSTLCNDGTCAAPGGSCDPSLESPCSSCTDLTVACQKYDDYYDNCTPRYQALFDTVDQCVAAEEEATQTLSWTGPAFLFCYCWMSIVCILIIGWCAYNQRLAPVNNSTKILNEAAEGDTTLSTDVSSNSWTQTGYRGDIVGLAIYLCTIFTLAGVQFLLFLLTIFYYMQTGDISRWSPVFKSETQVLLSFEIVWMVGFVFSFLLQWPFSIKSLFLRRCPFKDATHVAVFAPYAAPKVLNMKEESHISCIKKIIACTTSCVSAFMTFLFSEVYRPKGVRGKFMYCQVKTDGQGSKSFTFRLRRYNYNPETDVFEPGDLHAATTIFDFIKAKKGLTSDDVFLNRCIVGPNSIPMKKPKILNTIFTEFSKPFYIYQNFMVWVWFPLIYYYMAIVTTVVRLVGGLTVAFFTLRNERNLYRLSVVSGSVEVLRDGDFATIPQIEIVPGDVVVVEPGITYCDMVVVSAECIVVDESALTGEATPVTKTAVDVSDGKKVYHAHTHKKHTISAGTTIIETSVNTKDLAVVTKTGSFTAKGELLRSILSYERHQFKFDTEVKIVVLILSLYAVFGFAMTVYFLEAQLVYGWFYGMYVVATCLPPLLPTVFVVAVGHSNNRLANQRIVCSDTEGILVAGKVKIAFFDKTPTLTKQGLDFLSVRSADFWSSETQLESPSGILATGMSVCHTLTMSDSEKLIGNSVDLMMFTATGSLIKQAQGKPLCVTQSDGTEFFVVKRFEFDHHRMTQSVVITDRDGMLLVFVKGSAESIKRLCESESLPNDFDDAARSAARIGTYQIALAVSNPSFTVSQATDLSRDDIETGLRFIGFVNFKNVTKVQTPAVVEELKKGGVTSVMVTGDHILTGIHIAKEAGIIHLTDRVMVAHNVDDKGSVAWTDEESEEPRELPPLQMLDGITLAVQGSVWAHLLETDPDHAMDLAKHICVYGRCTPDDKASVIAAFVKAGFVTLMCGDGGNDCGALRTAHVGIALSDAEASIVSPFTSLDKDISSVIEVLKEGRCALASAFASYKYMIMYGQVETINQLANAYFKITFSEWCWVFMDGIWLITMAFSLPLARPAAKLAPHRPTSSLLGPHTMASVLGVLVINFLSLVVGLIILYHQDWFQCRKWGGTDVSNVTAIGDNYESTTIFIISGFQYISSAMAYNFGYTHRASWISNHVFVIFAVGWIAIQYYITLVPSSLSCLWRVNCNNEDTVRSVTTFERVPILNGFNTTEMPVSFRWILAAILTGNLFLNMSYEYFFVNGLWRKIVAHYKGQTKEAGTKLNASQNYEEGFELDPDSML